MNKPVEHRDFLASLAEAHEKVRAQEQTGRIAIDRSFRMFDENSVSIDGGGKDDKREFGCY